MNWEKWSLETVFGIFLLCFFILIVFLVMHLWHDLVSNYLTCLCLNSDCNQTKDYDPYWRTWWLKVAQAGNYAEWTEMVAWCICSESDAWHLVVITINDSVSSEWLMRDEMLWLCLFGLSPVMCWGLSLILWLYGKGHVGVAQFKCHPSPNMLPVQVILSKTVISCPPIWYTSASQNRYKIGSL